METTLDVPIHSESGSHRHVASDVERVPVVFVNAYLVGRREGPWVLVDTGLPGFASHVRGAAEARYGAWKPPEAIILTHGHFDHAGSAAELAEQWNVPIYVHPLELPFVTGKSDYPPQDPTVGGALGFMSRSFPHSGCDLSPRVLALPSDGSVPGLPEWRWIHTPGHTAGHISLFRDADQLLIAGDAFATVNQDSAVAMITQEPEFSVPPAPFTTDWDAAESSVKLLADREPRALSAGHGRPVRGPRIAQDLRHFADIFRRPRKGRYVQQPARTDENGVVYVPPPVRDPLPLQLLVGGVAVAAALLLVGRRH